MPFGLVFRDRVRVALVFEGKANPGGVTKKLPKNEGPLDRGIRRRFGPALHESAMRTGEERFDRMPEEFPPKREEIREQNLQIMRRVAEEETALAGVSGER